MQESTPSQAEGERPDENPPRDAGHRDAEPERTTPSQAEGEREPDDPDDESGSA
ncbi:hypothetical protein [Streptomyces sp. NPDC001744]|uniref:hypothetical protein n=1 Tax=Streptomyces sp. NPDC001744 TaxID=3364606 RepID=UPI0036ABF651